MVSSNYPPPGNEVAGFAHAFAATLEPGKRDKLQQPYSAAAAATWSNFPQGYLGKRHKRIGLPTRKLDKSQWRALDDLLAAALGKGREQGFDQLSQHLAADDYLHAIGAGDHYGRGNFFVAYLGKPSNAGAWQLQFGGHHLAVSNSYHHGKLVGATPSFRGIEPFPSFEFDGRRHTPMTRKCTAIAELLHSLTKPQLEQARLRGSWPDVVLGPGDDHRFPTTSKGITGADLSAAQRKLLIAAMAEWVRDTSDRDAAEILADYAGAIEETHLAFAGKPKITRPGDYARIDGPRVWIELSMHEGIVLTTPHPHSVWRDRLTDYGGRDFPHQSF
ncbi:DUF3500 domain-containing protein [Amycolatopsis sp. WQ 127309]|uniref:DUF3500 domain-containing protein n=1 Tax=Amycolatopsis sp. WQ 127309 TaxID=2932773 RepID=UPI001FF4CF55|nr:DUF3500 domain-containing protein [Amycolatopsis sp. WQ 127309]UOZ05536.1 DUF3500 domain-containing protein [Amycolatopsis sp. WQ 127309]